MLFQAPAWRDKVSRLKGNAALLTPSRCSPSPSLRGSVSEPEKSRESCWERRQRAPARPRKVACGAPPRRQISHSSSRGGKWGPVRGRASGMAPPLASARTRIRMPSLCSPRFLGSPTCPHARVVNESRVLSRQDLAMAFPSPSKAGVRPS